MFDTKVESSVCNYVIKFARLRYIFPKLKFNLVYIL